MIKYNKSRIRNLGSFQLISKTIFCLCLLLSYKANAQIITTYAGNGSAGFSGDGDLAVKAQLYYPMGLAFDKAGNLYIVDVADNVIRKVDAVTKVITTVVGGGTNYGNGSLSDARLLGPRGIAIDKDNNIYIADAGTCIRKVDMTAQTITTIAGTHGVTSYYNIGMGNGGLALDAHFDGIAGMAFDADGNLYVADMLNFCIRRIDAKTQIITMYAGEPFGNDVPTVEMSINQVLDVALDKEGNVYIPDQGMIRKIDAVTHQVTTLAGKMYHSECSGDGGPAVDATLSPIGVTVDDDHNVYVTDWGNQRVRKIDGKTGIISTIAGNGTESYTGDCGPSEQSTTNWPWAIKTDKSGQVFFTEMHNYTVRKIAGNKPNVITGANALCLHDSLLLQNEATGGVWASSNLAVATVDNKGSVKGVATGTANITYTVEVEGCSFTTSQHTIEVKSVDETTAILSSQNACIGSTILLNSSGSNGIWLSSDSSVGFVNSNGFINSKKTGTVELTYLMQDKCSITDKVSLQVFQPQKLFIGNDTSFCKNTPLIIDAGNQFTNYQWSTGAVSSSITVDAPGMYSVSATDRHQCISTDSLTVKQVFDNPVINWQPVSVLCKGSPLLLTTPADAASILWQDSSSEKTFSVTHAGTYWVRVTDNNHCTGSDTLVIEREVAPPSHFLPADTVICSYNKLLLTPAATFVSYQWSTGNTSSSITIENSGLYSLQVTDQYNCTGKDSIVVNEKTCNNNVYFPTAFTPNDDGVNDWFKPKVYGSLLKFSMRIYNRWGKQVFETNNPQQGWNGRINNVLQDAETYIWYATYQLPDNKEKSEKGVFVLVR